jgi:ubiquinone/menaquinone biosynthesis C-methylase UbiE
MSKKPKKEEEISEETLKSNIKDEYFKKCEYKFAFHGIDAAFQYNDEPVI